MNTEQIYLDYAAATPLDADVLAAMTPYLTERFYNPSSPYAPAVEVRRDYEVAKHAIAQTIGGRVDELVMTAGATESINLAFAATDGHVVTTAIEHHAVLRAAEAREATIVPVTPAGLVEAQAVAEAIRPDTQLVSVAVANNELGTIQPLRQVAARVADERRRRQAAGETTPLYLHSDGSQGVGLLDLHVSRLGVDMLTLNAAKVYGPKQVGALWASPRVLLRPLVHGGGQERGLRSGTENVAGTIGFASALAKAEAARQTEPARLRELRDDLAARLLAAYPEAVVSGHPRHQLTNFLHISFPGINAERVLFLLEARGVLVATGSACAASQSTRSHVLEAIGLVPDVADGSVRITLGRSSDSTAIARASKAIIEAVAIETARMAA